jgi:hypothetical protein
MQGPGIMLALHWSSLLLGAAIGALAGWLITHVYYKRGQADAQRTLRTLTRIAIQLEREGRVKLARAPDGNITGGELTTGRIDSTLTDATGNFIGSFIPPRE